MSRLRVDGRIPTEDMDPRNDQEESERAASAETWILAGGSWKKRREAAETATVTPSSNNSTTSSSVAMGNRHHRNGSPRASSPRANNRALSPLSYTTATSTRSNASAKLGNARSAAVSPPPGANRSRSTLSPASARPISPGSNSQGRAVSPRTFSPSKATARRTTDGGTPTVATTASSISSSHTFTTGEGFVRSSSGLSAGVSSRASADTRRSNRTAQTEPARLSMAATVASASSTAARSIPDIVVEDKKRGRSARGRAKKGSSSKPAQTWIKEKDDFFSATRFSESVARASSRQQTVPRNVQVTTRNRTLSPPTNHQPYRAKTPPPKLEMHWVNSKASPRRPLDRPISPPTEWSQARVVSPPRSPDRLSLQGTTIALRKQRSRSVSPKVHRMNPSSPTVPSHNNDTLTTRKDAADGVVLFPQDSHRMATLETPKRGSRRFAKKFRSPSPPQTRANESQPKNSQQSAARTHGLPQLHVNAIRSCFGADCDIYRDVLKVGRHASGKQLRIAYFRRGRNVLAEQQDSPLSKDGKSGMAAWKDLSTETKEKFQAVSLAYEIISEPEWRTLYDQNGWDVPLIDVPPKKISLLQSTKLRPNNSDVANNLVPEPSHDRSVSKTRFASPILRPPVNNHDERRSRSVGRGITWSEQVEELVFRQDPEEIESRRVRSPPPPEPSIFEEDWVGGPAEPRVDTASFMATFLIDLDHSLDGLEASLDGLWSLSSGKSENDTQDKETSTPPPIPDRIGRTSPVSMETQLAQSTTTSVMEDDATLPSKLSQSGQCSTASRERQAPVPESWDGMESASSTLPSTIHPDDESEDAVVQHLFDALTKTSDERRKREGMDSRIIPEVLSEDSSMGECASPNDVKRMPVSEDEAISIAFSESGKESLNSRSARKVTADEFFDPFEDTISTIKDADFDSPLRPINDPSDTPVTEEDLNSIASSPSRLVTRSLKADRAASPLHDELFSENLAEFQDLSHHVPVDPHVVDASSLNRMQSGFSSITGTHSSVFNATSTPGRGQGALQAKFMRQEGPGNTTIPCDTAFLSHLFCFTDALSADLASFGDDFASKISATQAIIIESLTFAEARAQDAVGPAKEIPEVERCNTI